MANQQINNDVELLELLKKITNEVIDEVSKKLLNILQYNIQQLVYTSPRSFYVGGTGEPTGEFLESWVINKDTNGATIEQDLEKMRVSSVYRVHGGESTSYSTDARAFISYYINEGASGPLFGSGFWTEPRPFWDETLRLIQEGTVDTWIEEAFRKRGIEVS